MPDNTQLPTGAGGDTIRTLDRTGLGLPKTEVVQLDAAGNSLNAESLVSGNNPLPVQSALDQLRAALALQAAAYLAAQPQNGFTPLELPAFLTQLSNPAVYPQINAEALVGVVPINTNYPAFNLLRYGADRTGAVASDAAMASAIAVCGTSGGTIYAPNGTYSFASPINLNLKNGITILGDGGVSSGLTPGTRLQYTGIIAPFITMNGAQGGALRELQIVHTNVVFAGPYLQANALSGRDASEIGTYNCEFGTNSDPVIHFDINTSDGFHANRCVFQFGNPSVSGALVGGYCNNVSFTDCEWFNCTGVPIQASGPCQAWLFSGCIFEYLPVPGTAGAILSTANTGIFVGLTVQGCWFGDVPASGGGTWIDIYGQNLVATGNYISGNTGAPLAATAITLRSFAGAVIMGNTITSFLNGINFATASMQQIVVKGNTFNSVTNAYVNPANVLAGINEFWPNFGTGTLVPTGMTIPPPSAGNNLILNGPSGQFALRVNGNSAASNSDGVQVLAGTNVNDAAVQIYSQDVTRQFLTIKGNAAWSVGNTTDNPTYAFLGTGAFTIGGPLGVNGSAAPAKVTGFGTPTGTGVIANFPGAGPATLAQCSQAIAQLITDLKAFGLYGA